MSQGLDVEQGTRKWGGQTVSVVQEVSRDNGHSATVIDSTLAAGIIQDSTLLYPSAGLVPRSSNNRETLVRSLDIWGSVTILFFCDARDACNHLA